MACLTPFNIRNTRYTGLGSSTLYIPVPCGKCVQCLKRRVSQWSFRLLQEERVSSSAFFVTLTYDVDHVPILFKPAGSGYMTLVKRDLQLFFKRLRRISPPYPKIKYYAAGEYGSESFRPHYHVIIFNAQKELIYKAWSAGHVDIGTVTSASVGYTLKYVNKGKLIPMHANDDRLPEFSLMSLSMGSSYLTPAVYYYHRNDVSRNYVMLDGGVKASLPRFYREARMLKAFPRVRNKLFLACPVSRIELPFGIYSDAERDVQAALIEAEQADLETARYRAYVERNGSGDGYTFDRYQRVKADLDNWRRQCKLNRDVL